MLQSLIPKAWKSTLPGNIFLAFQIIDICPNGGVIISYMDRFSFVVLLALSSCFAGCVPIPVGSERPAELADNQTLDSLIGENKTTILTSLGRPNIALVGEKSSYFIYGGHGDEYQLLLMVYVPVAGPSYGGGKLFCLLLEFDKENIFRRYEINRHSVIWSDRENVSDCALSFFTPDELAVFMNEDAVIEAYKQEVKQQRRKKVQDRLDGSLDKAVKGDPESQYKLFIIMSNEYIEPISAGEWLCKAANKGHNKAQKEVGFWYKESVWNIAKPERKAWLQKAGIHANNKVAYIWYTIAAKEDPDRLRTINDQFLEKLSDGELAEAKEIIRNWRPGECPIPN